MLLPGNASRAEGSFLGIYKRACLQAPLEMLGNDPGASYMQSMLSTTELHPHSVMPPGIVRRERAHCKKLCSVCVPVSDKKNMSLGAHRCAQRGYSSVVEHLTADQEVLGSNPGAPSESIANWLCHRTHKEYDKCHLLCFSREAIRFSFSIVCHNCSTTTQINPRAFDQQGWSCFFPYCSSQDGRAV